MINFEGSNKLNNKINQLSIEKLEKVLPKNEIEILLKKLKARAEIEMTEIGSFRPIQENIKNHKPVIEIGNISLNIRPTSNLNSSKERVLETSVSTKSGQYIIEKQLAEGNRDEILKYLNDKHFDENFKRFLMECSDNFEQKGLE